MQLPFSRDAFLDVFAAYNTSLWPVALALWLATLAALVARLGGRDRSEWTFGLLAVQWAWAAVAYHMAFFSRINPAAWIFALLFLIQASLLTWYGIINRRLRFSRENTIVEFAAYGLITYGLVYPLLTLADGHSYPRVPMFGVPCPTTIVTVGFLLLAGQRIPPLVAMVPLAWAAIAGSSAFQLGVHADLALLVAAAFLAHRTWSTRAAIHA